MIQLKFRSRIVKNPIPIPSVLRNPTPPKIFRIRNPGTHKQGLRAYDKSSHYFPLLKPNISQYEVLIK